MSDATFPAHLVDLQKRSHAAWDAVEQHRKTVDEARRQEAESAGARAEETRPWGGMPLRPWTEAEDKRHAELMAAATEAAEALRAGILGAGLTPDYATAQGLHKAARA